MLPLMKRANRLPIRNIKDTIQPSPNFLPTNSQEQICTNEIAGQSSLCSIGIISRLLYFFPLLSHPPLNVYVLRLPNQLPASWWRLKLPDRLHYGPADLQEMKAGQMLDLGSGNNSSAPTLRTGFNQHPCGKEVQTQAIQISSQLANSEYRGLLLNKNKQKTITKTTTKCVKFWKKITQ